MVSVGVGQRTKESKDSGDLAVVIHFCHIEPGDNDLAVSADLPRVAVQTMVAIDPARARLLRAWESRLHVVNVCLEIVKTVRLNAGIDEFDTGRRRPLKVAPHHRRIRLVPPCKHVVERVG